MSFSWSGSGSRARSRRSSGNRETDPEKRLQSDLLRYLKMRERSAWELRFYLKRRGHQDDRIEKAVTEACECGYINDARFADMFLRDRRRLRPMSRAAVLRELKQKGVEPETAAAALAGADPPWDDYESAFDAVNRRWCRWNHQGRRQKAAGFLKRRGFSGSVIWSVVDRLESEQENEQNSFAPLDQVSSGNESEFIEDEYSDEVE